MKKHIGHFKMAAIDEKYMQFVTFLNFIFLRGIPYKTSIYKHFAIEFTEKITFNACKIKDGSLSTHHPTPISCIGVYIGVPGEGH